MGQSIAALPVFGWGDGGGDRGGLEVMRGNLLSQRKGGGDGGVYVETKKEQQ